MNPQIPQPNAAAVIQILANLNGAGGSAGIAVVVSPAAAGVVLAELRELFPTASLAFPFGRPILFGPRIFVDPSMRGPLMRGAFYGMNCTHPNPLAVSN